MQYHGGDQLIMLAATIIASSVVRRRKLKSFIADIMAMSSEDLAHNDDFK